MNDNTKHNSSEHAEGQSRLNERLGDGTIYRHFDGMCWPAAGDGLGILEWTMRYGNSEQQRMVAASVISAYSRLIELPDKRRNAIVRELRKGPGKESPNV